VAKNKHRGATLDEFLAQEGMLEEFQAKAIKEVVAWQFAEAMRAQAQQEPLPSRCTPAVRRSIACSIPEAGNVTIETLQRAAALVGRRVKIELVDAA
jgi:antitoxin HicB